MYSSEMGDVSLLETVVDMPEKGWVIQLLSELQFKWEESCSIKDVKMFLQKFLGKILKVEKERPGKGGLGHRLDLSTGCRLTIRMW